MNEAPLILTLRFDPDSFERFDAERRRHFPAERNFIPAHLTLFHHLDGTQHAAISAAVAESAEQQAPFDIAVQSLRFLGQGTAYALESTTLQALRAEFAERWAPTLTRQDQQGFRPHVTIQNKVPAHTARTLFDSLSASFEPFDVRATGLLLWHYEGGPWRKAGEYAFNA